MSNGYPTDSELLARAYEQAIAKDARIEELEEGIVAALELLDVCDDDYDLDAEELLRRLIGRAGET